MPDGDLFYATAVGRYYKVYKDGVYVSQHTTEREAADRCHNLCFLFPESDIKYIHEYEVKVGLTDAGITEAKDYGTPVDQPPTISSTPSPSFTVGILATYDMKQHVTDDGVSTVTYTIQNVLPNGLDMNETTGILTYDGAEPSSASQHTLTATDAVGSAISNSFDVQVSETPDVTAPNTPTGLAAGSETSSQITLSWNAATDPNGATGENVSGIANYKLYRDTNLVASPTELATVDNNLQSETSYDYQVSAVDNAGNESPLSSTVSASTTAAAAYVPGEPWGYKVNNDGFGISQGGTFIDGGRGQDPQYVTTLDPTAGGSLKALVENGTAGPILFEVGGIVDALGTNTGINMIDASNKTVWGNTAPGGHFNLHMGGGFRNGAWRVNRGCSNIIIQHIAIRATDTNERDCFYVVHGNGVNVNEMANNILVANMSFAFGSDEQYGFANLSNGSSGSRAPYDNNVTFYKCFASYPLQSPTGAATHGLNQILSAGINVGNIECIMAHGKARPRIAPYDDNCFINTLFYKWISNYIFNPTDSRLVGAPNSRIRWEGCKYSANGTTYPGFNQPGEIGHNGDLGSYDGSIYENDNDYGGFGIDQSEIGGLLTGNDAGFLKPDGYDQRLLTSAQLDNDWIDTVGANPGTPDSVDISARNDVKNNVGDFIDNPSDIGGYPNLPNVSHAGLNTFGNGDTLQAHLEAKPWWNTTDGYATTGRHSPCTQLGHTNRTRLEAYLDTFVSGVPGTDPNL